MDHLASTANRPNITPNSRSAKAKGKGRGPSPSQTTKHFGQQAKSKYNKMAAATPFADSALIGVCLIIRAKEGPRWVFQYPHHPTLQAPRRDNLYGTDLVDEPEEEEEIGDDESDLEDEDDSELTYAMGKMGLSKLVGSSSRKSSHVEQSLKDDEHYDTKWGEHHVPWDHVLDFTTDDLESILTPSKSFNKKKFELCLDPYYFVSHPIYIREDGGWKKKKKAKKSKKGQKGEENEEGTTADPKGKGKQPADDGSEDGDDHGGMTMFNVVFILNYEKQSIDQKIAEMYENVIKMFNKALHHAQAQSDFVWKESEMILAMKEKAKEERRPMSWLWNEILLQSTLAASIRDVYVAVSNNKIATVQLATTPPLDLSFQIPIPLFLSSLPGPSERAMPGLRITGADPMVKEEGDDGTTHINKHFALLLLNDEEKVKAEIQADNTDLSIPLLECIRLCKPTQSFLQVAQANSIEIDSLLVLVQHLIYWRRAMAIPPLHGRETYIVNPNCDSRKLPEASIAWKKAFPMSPTLPSFLATISAAPRPYKSFAPSPNHRPTYLDMLAWLMRGGWVTQLRTFGWVLVWPEILYEVDYQLKADAIDKAKKKAASGEPNSGESAGSTDESGPEKKVIDPNAPMTIEEAAETARLERLAQKLIQNAAEEAAAFAKMPVPVATVNPSCNEEEYLEDLAPYIIKDPLKVSHEESLYIAAIGKRMTDEKAKLCWGKFMKYFNGEDALEMIALREGMKRKETWKILEMFQEHLLFCRHW